MSNTLLQLSHKPALRLHARVVADVQKVAAPLGVRLMMSGAFARDLHLHHAWGVPVRRETHDVDFALAVPDWPAFQALRAALLASGQFVEASGVLHRLRHSQGLPIDLVPFGAIETAQRQIVWPPAGDLVMDVFGFQEAWATAVNVALPDDVQAAVVSLPALAWLKMVCWQDRHRRSPGKDAQDLQLILNHYLDAGNEPRLWNEFVAWTQQDGFDYTLTAARMLGRDMRHQLNAEARARIAAIVGRQTDTDRPDLLPNEMNPRNPEQAVAQLRSLLQGLNTDD
ncbi:nucleotidyl transferase AbiEii/AbiGii toxin family protein [Leptospira sp. 96542]|nr:nucleotidyl transferase AbiEii/AbiGii toxin family protein [Leptospira sp. 96542]